MANNQDKINQLALHLERLLKRQEAFTEEVKRLQKELQQLQNPDATPNVEKIEETPIQKEVASVKKVVPEPIIPPKEQEKPTATPQKVVAKTPTKTSATQSKPRVKSKSSLEKFIGENLINKIGIVITIIGVAIGAKYSIENNLISPPTRMILGYLTGIGLLGFGIKLKAKYKNYSAVLVSGAMAIMYFITFASHSFYDLIPQTVAFIMMVLFTVFTVIAALNYNKQIIAIIGLVGAYAVPFFLSDGSGKVGVLFSYMAILNIGILAIAFKKYWKPLYYIAFSLSWIIFLTLAVTTYSSKENFGLFMVFLTIFFLIFYITFIAYKLIKKEKFGVIDILLLVCNTFIFYGIGYVFIDSQENGETYLGLFTLGNAIIHFIVSVLFYRRKLADKNLFYLIVGLVLVFITIAVPVQLDGNWVTLAWAGLTALLFWIGRSQKVSMYENLAYPLLILTFFSLVHDWLWTYDYNSFNDVKTSVTPLLNINFLTAMIVAASFGFITYFNNKKKSLAVASTKKVLGTIFSVITPLLLCIVLFFAFAIEIDTYWDNLRTSTKIDGVDDLLYHSRYNPNYHFFNGVWLINYALLFFTLMGFLNIFKIKSRVLGIINLVFNLFVLFIFLTVGLYMLSELRENYLEQKLGEYFDTDRFNLIIRYISFAFVGLLLYSIWRYAKASFMKINFKVAFKILLHIAIIWIASSELLNWMDIAGNKASYKLSLSIFWGMYSLLLIILGIWKKKQYLRLGAIILFGVTLIKLFAYDISHLNTISKTIVFVALGILLLIISFLYNKYKNVIADEPKD